MARDTELSVVHELIHLTMAKLPLDGGDTDLEEETVKKISVRSHGPRTSDGWRKRTTELLHRPGHFGQGPRLIRIKTLLLGKCGREQLGWHDIRNWRPDVSGQVFGRFGK